MAQMHKGNDLEVTELGRQDTSDAGEIDSIKFAPNGNALDQGLQRGLKGRHLQLFAIGSVIGSSIWYGGGIGIQYGGPATLLISFLILGIDLFFVMQSLGELATLFPVPGAFNELAARFIDPAASFALAWNYWYLWIAVLAGEYNGISLVMGLWTDVVPTYGWILISFFFFGALALLQVSIFGEMEFWFAIWKVFTIACAFLIAILLNAGAIGGDYVGFRYWKDPGSFTNGINGFGQAFVMAAAYYAGSEIVSLTGAESKNPRRDLPKAIRLTIFRIFIIFVGMIFFSTLLVPYNSPALKTAKTKSGRSPWTIALNEAGWSGAGHLINVVILTGYLSAAVLYVVSRVTMALAQSGRAPAFLAKTNSKGVPVNAIIFCNLFGLVSIMNISSGAGTVFGYLQSIVGSSTFIVWTFIGICHIRFRRAYALQGMNVTDLPFRALLFPYGAYFIVIFNAFLILVSGYTCFLTPFDLPTFITSYITIVLFAILYIGWKLFKKTKLVKLAEMDLVSGRKDYNQEEEAAHSGPGLLTRLRAKFAQKSV